MKTNIYLVLKLIFIYIPLSGLFYILEYGFIFDSSDKLLRPFLLSGFAAVMFFKPNVKRYSLFLIGCCLILIILTNIFSLENFSKNISDFGFSLLLVTIVLYLPQIIKKGYIERF